MEKNNKPAIFGWGRDIQNIYIELWLMKHELVFSMTERILTLLGLIASLASCAFSVMVVVSAFQGGFFALACVFILWFLFVAANGYETFDRYISHRKFPKKVDVYLENERLRDSIMQAIDSEADYLYLEKQVRAKIDKLL